MSVMQELAQAREPCLDMADKLAAVIQHAHQAGESGTPTCLLSCLEPRKQPFVWPLRMRPIDLFVQVQ